MSTKLTFDRAEVVGLLVDMGFKSAREWDDHRITRKLIQLPRKVEDVDVAEEFRHIYHALARARDAEIVLVEPKQKPVPAPAPQAPASPSQSGQAAGGVKRGGWKRGAISSLVDPLVTDEWRTDEEIAKKAGLPLQKVRDRLYFLAYVGRAVRRRLIQVKLVKTGE